mgnify:FL=1
MEIKLCDNNAEWDNWFKKQGQNEFLQSWDWGAFQANTGKPVIRLQAVEGGEIVWQGQCLEHRLGLGVKYAYLPRVSDCGSVISDQLSVFLKNNNFAFISIE